MKVKVALLLLVAALLVSGCQAKPSGQAGPQKPAEETYSMRMMMGPMGGTLYPLGATIADILFENFPNVRANVTPGGAISNVVAIEKNNAQMGHTTTETAACAINGVEPFEEKHENVRGLMKVMSQPIQFVVAADCPITSFKEIKEKQYPLKLAVNPPGNASELLARVILEYYGITYDDIKAWGGSVDHVSHADMTSLYKDRHVEAMMLYTALPSPVFVECALTRPLRLLPVDEDCLAFLQKNYGLEPFTATKDTYKGMTEDTQIVTGGLMLAINKDVPEDLVYNMLKVIFEPENLKRIKATHKGYEDYLTPPERAAQGMSIPWHPGAEKYYKEVGWIK